MGDGTTANTGGNWDTSAGTFNPGTGAVYFQGNDVSNVSHSRLSLVLQVFQPFVANPEVVRQHALCLASLPGVREKAEEEANALLHIYELSREQ